MNLDFNSQSFTRILPFNEQNPLYGYIESDHAAIAVKVDDEIIQIENISNPKYHHFFGSVENSPFHHTDLYVKEPYIDGKLDERLVKKIDYQTDRIANDFINGRRIQIIVEGYDDFFIILTEKIRSHGHTQFEILNLFRKKDVILKPHDNVTAILVDTSRFKIIDKAVTTIHYAEKEDNDKRKEMSIPHVKLINEITKKQFLVMGIHVNGCKSQNPISGLEAVTNQFNYLVSQYDCSSYIMAGDFNTTPENIKEGVIKTIGSKAKLLQAPYPTHVNPNNDATNYDHAIVVNNDPTIKHEMLPLSSMPQPAQNLVNSIYTSRANYLASKL